MPTIESGQTFYDKLPDGRYERCVLQPTTDVTPDRMNASRGGTGEFYKRIPVDELGKREDNDDDVMIMDATDGTFVFLVRDESLVTSKPTGCDHGVVFDQFAADELLKNWQPENETEFIMGNPASSEIRKRWPRLGGMCPKGCGYNGIYYASWEHYMAGDW